MRYLILSSLPIMLLIISCSENNPTEPKTYTDSELKAKIVGTWSNDYVSVSYNANGDFLETIDIDYTIGDTTINQSEVIKGTYDIEDGILKYNITEWNTNNNFITGYIPPNSKIVIVRDLLYLYHLNILTRIGDDTDSLWGQWYTFDWTHKYSDPQVFGKLEQTYNFDKDSMTVTHGTRHPFDSSAVFYYQTELLTYNPPELSWDNDIPRIIEFHGSQMWMFYKPSSTHTPLKKIK